MKQESNELPALSCRRRSLHSLPLRFLLRRDKLLGRDDKFSGGRVGIPNSYFLIPSS